jgi:phosphotransferase system enzyme I (PtsI)
MNMQHILKGRAVSQGIAIGPALVCRSKRGARRDQQVIPEYEPLYARATGHEIERLNAALHAADAALVAAAVQLKGEGEVQQAAIFNVQRTLLAEPGLRERAITLIAESGWLAADALGQAGEEYAGVLAASGDPDDAERAADVRAVAGQVWRILMDDIACAERLHQPSILVMDDIDPAELMSMPRDRILGIVLGRSGLTAHATILARAWSIPVVTGLGSEALQHVQNGMTLALDGVQGDVVLCPDDATLAQMHAAADALARQQHELRSQRDQPSVTLDGHHMTLLANVSSLAGAQAAREWGAAGVGSLRTELLFLGHSCMPSEDEQVETYLRVAAELPGRPIVARTLDMGGDKQLPIYPLPLEDNPFLGWRGIRIGLGRVEELLLPQIRAMLRAGAEADIRIVAPMISTLDEWRHVRALVAQAHAELTAAGVPCAPNPRLGVLIEVPAAALRAEQLAQEADFMSIGSNDLVQYTLACDRTNPHVAHLYQPLEPAILHLLHTITEAAHRHGRSVSLCGEMASDAQITPLLLGLDIDELSCTPPALPTVRAAVRATSATEARQLASAALQAASLEEVHAVLRDYELARAEPLEQETMTHPVSLA